MNDREPLSLAQLGGVGVSVVATLLVAVTLGLLAARYLHWNWAVPASVLLGFAAGIYSIYRQLRSRM
ncbi:MAG: AtpZ/AtpI family protein [Candidatus Eremiobacteraeota bacterium]|nr:AtpZ/AtpI family protein [Candidatus Eremiobacteraeota bacterium]